MVTDQVVVKKGFNYSRLFFIIGGIIVLLAIIYLGFLLGAIFGSPKSSIMVNYTNPVLKILENYEQQGIEVNEKSR